MQWCTWVRVREQPPKDPSWRLVLVIVTSLPPKPKVAAAGRFSHAGTLASGGAAPVLAFNLNHLRTCLVKEEQDDTFSVQSMPRQ